MPFKPRDKDTVLVVKLRKTRNNDVLPCVLCFNRLTFVPQQTNAMLDIIILIFLTRSIGDLAIQKGLKPGTWKVYLVLAWLAGELLGIFIGVLMFGIEKPLMILLVALPCAVAGYHIIRNTLDRKPDVMKDEINQIGDNLVP